MKKSVSKKVFITFSELTNILASMFGFRKDGTPADGCVMVSATWVKDTDSFNKDLKAIKATDENGKEYGRKLKANNPYYNRLSAIKVGSNLQFGYNYENATNNHLEKQGDERTFEAGELRWGHWYEYDGRTLVNRVIEHNDNLYIRLYKPKNVKVLTTYFLDGKRVTDSAIITDIKRYIDDDDDDNIKTQEKVGLSVENQVKPFAVKYANLRHLSINKNKYFTII